MSEAIADIADNGWRIRIEDRDGNHFILRSMLQPSTSGQRWIWKTQ